jgi:hypothetical protein
MGGRTELPGAATGTYFFLDEAAGFAFTAALGAGLFAGAALDGSPIPRKILGAPGMMGPAGFFTATFRSLLVLSAVGVFLSWSEVMRFCPGCSRMIFGTAALLVDFGNFTTFGGAGGACARDAGTEPSTTNAQATERSSKQDMTVKSSARPTANTMHRYV